MQLILATTCKIWQKGGERCLTCDTCAASTDDTSADAVCVRAICTELMKNLTAEWEKGKKKTREADIVID